MSPQREHLLYPWFTCKQTIENSEAWATAAAIRTGEMAALYIGDSAGTLTVYTPEAGHDKRFHGYELERHSLCVNTIWVHGALFRVGALLLCLRRSPTT